MALCDTLQDPEAKLDHTVLGMALCDPRETRAKNGDIVGWDKASDYGPGGNSIHEAVYLICSTLSGMCLRIDVGTKLVANPTPPPPEVENAPVEDEEEEEPKDLGHEAGPADGHVIADVTGLITDGIRAEFFYHVGSVWAMATVHEREHRPGWVATGGDDFLLCLWETRTYKLVARAVMPVRRECVCMPSSVVAVGFIERL